MNNVLGNVLDGKSLTYISFYSADLINRSASALLGTVVHSVQVASATYGSRLRFCFPPKHEGFLP